MILLVKSFYDYYSFSGGKSNMRRQCLLYIFVNSVYNKQKKQAVMKCNFCICLSRFVSRC